MSRTARVVLPGLPHHVTQRGNYRQDVFLTDDHRRRYLEWLHDYSARFGCAVWAYCLMSNHVHLVVMPAEEESLARTLAATHMRHAQMLNQELGASGHLWQGRFHSCPLDDEYAVLTARYVERNPVRAGVVAAATNWPWSSARAHALAEPDPLLSVDNWLPDELRREWASLLAEPLPESVSTDLRKRTRTGRPLGSDSFVARLEQLTGRSLRDRPRGRPRKGTDGERQ